MITSGQKCEHKRQDRVHAVAKAYDIKNLGTWCSLLSLVEDCSGIFK